MFVKEKDSGDLIRVEKLDQLADPLSTVIVGRRQAGEEEQDPREFSKEQLLFPSGEALPACWVDESYQLKTASKAG